MPRKRQNYTAEFKLQAVRMLTDQGLSVAEVSLQLGVPQNCLRLWRKTFQEHGDAAFPGHGKLSKADQEIARLRTELRRVEAERDLLKKALVYFASLTD
jgi:transposase